jgi:hypothetical protein
MPWALCVGGQRDGQQFPDVFKVDGGAQVKFYPVTAGGITPYDRVRCAAFLDL